MNRWLRAIALLGMVLGLSLGAGCAQERDPINQVQPNALNKHFFLGADLSDAADDPQFFWRAYVVDGSASSAIIGIGSWQGVDRIVWEVTENALIARKAYGIADGQDNKSPGNADPNAITGTDAYGRRLVKSQNGTVVATYAILSHFDVRRAYNPATGEELNVVQENTTDRPWYQREFMRVDWSTNRVDNPMWLDVFLGRMFGEIRISPLPYSYAVSDSRNEDAPVIDEASGYMDITNKFFVEPEMTSSPFTDLAGNVPTCLVVGLFTGSATFECDAQEAVVRQSYWRIDPKEHDVEPFEFTKANGDVIGNPGGYGNSYLVGIGTPGRQGYDPQYGFTEKQLHKFAHRHNTWKAAHVEASCTSNDDLDDGAGSGTPNGTADQCETVNTAFPDIVKHKGSQCDIFVKKCTLPFRDRAIKPVGYWINKEAPAALLDTVDGAGNIMERGPMEDLIDSWNQLMRQALASAREVECRRTGDGDRDECHAQFFDSGINPTTGVRDPAQLEPVSMGSWLIEKAKPLPQDPNFPDKWYPNEPQFKGAQSIVFCHNPVREYDHHETCGPTGAVARVGDIRKNFLYYWPYDSRAPWGGIGNWNGDPLTGEIIGGAAQIMGRSASASAAFNRDVIQIALGDIKVEDIIQGVQADRFGRALQNGRSPLSEGLSEIAQQKALDAIDWGNIANVLPQSQAGSPQARQMETLQTMANSVADPTQFSNAQLQWEAIANKLRGSKYEAMGIDGGWLVDALGTSPSTPLDKSVLERASPLRGLDAGRLYALRDVLERRLDARGVCFFDHHAPAYGSVAIPSLAKYFKDKYPGDSNDPIAVKNRGEKIYEELWKETVRGIELHEIGHSLGMFHNFGSSWDSMNYNPQYWQLRTNEGQAVTRCTGPRTGPNDTCMGPRYNDPETLDEQGLGEESRPNIMYYANTSTMEYQFERFMENVGLGTYDAHFMKALYGGVVETIDSRVIPALGEQRSIAWRGFSQLIDKDLFNGNFRHYTEMARLVKTFDPARDCREATPQEKAHGKWRVVHNKLCAPTPKDVWKWSDFKYTDYMYFNNGRCTPGNAQCSDVSGPYFRAEKVYDGKGAAPSERIRWHYKFGQSNNAYFHTNPSDGGADAYEVATNTIRAFDLSYPWSYFRRGRREFYYRTLPSSIADRTFARLRSYNWGITNDLGRSQPAAANDDNQYKPEVMAQAEIAKYITRVVTMPEPGGYRPSAAFTGPDSFKQIFDIDGGGTAQFNVGIVDGRYLMEDYNNQLGGSWDYLRWINWAGFRFEKQRMMTALVDTRPTLFSISRQNALDNRNVNVNFRSGLPSFVDRLLGSVMASDWDTLGQYVAGNDMNKTPELKVLDLTAGTATRADPNAKVIFPNIGYDMQVQTAIQAALFAALSGDTTLQNKMRVFKDGGNYQINYPDNQKIMTSNPSNGVTYVARRYGVEEIDGKRVERGIASRMVQHANALIATAYVVNRCANGNLFCPSTLNGASACRPANQCTGGKFDDAVRDQYDRPQLILDANGNPQLTGALTESTIIKYMTLLDAVEEIDDMVGINWGDTN